MNAERFCTSVEKKMRGGLFSIMVLHTISSAKRPIHGYLITRVLDEMTGGTINIKAGTIYPILRNLKELGLVEHTTMKSTRGPPRKVYMLTSDGERTLERIDVYIDGLFRAVEKVRNNTWETSTV